MNFWPVVRMGNGEYRQGKNYRKVRYESVAKARYWDTTRRENRIIATATGGRRVVYPVGWDPLPCYEARD